MYRAILFLFLSTQAFADTQPIVNTINGIRATGFLGHKEDLKRVDYTNIELPTDDLPEAYDSRNQITMPPIRDQGACGSCWAHAPVRALEINISKTQSKVLDLSEQDMTSCESSAYKCSGGFMESAKYLLTGITDEKTFPYKASNLKCRKTKKIAKAMAVKLLGAKDRRPSIEEIKTAILLTGSSFVTVAAGSGWDGSSGELSGKACRYKQTNHMVVVVGWTVDNKWIMANSWGDRWGADGYALVPFDCANIGEEAGYVLAEPV